MPDLKATARNVLRAMPGGFDRGVRRAYYRLKGIEAEIALLPQLCPPGCTALDIGANRGMYSLFLSEIAGRVVCYEPNPVLSADLESMFRGRHVDVRNAGLGEEVGRFKLYIPRVASRELDGWASLENHFEGAVWRGQPVIGVREVEVEVKRLDDEPGLTGVGFAKIDVEGREDAVLRGGEQFLARERPNLLIEIEQRHHDAPIAGVFEWLEARGYRAWYLDGEGRLVKVTAAEVAGLQQEPGGEGYVYNFVFEHPDGPACSAGAES